MKSYKKSKPNYAHLCILFCMFSMIMAGCGGGPSRELAEGGYLGDKVLYQYDQALVEYFEITESLLEVAERNKVAVQESDSLSKFVSDLKRDRISNLKKAYELRDLYVLAQLGKRMDEFTSQERLMRFAINASRRYLITLATSDQ